MIIRTPRDLGHLIRDQRRQNGLTQERLAAHIGVSRKWIVEIERGKPSAELTLVLRTLKALNVDLDAHSRATRRVAKAIDVNAIVDATRRTRG